MEKRWKCIIALCIVALLSVLMPINSMYAEAEDTVDEAAEPETAEIISADAAIDSETDEVVDPNDTSAGEEADTADNGITETEDALDDDEVVRWEDPSEESSESEASNEENEELEALDEENMKLEASNEKDGESEETPGADSEDSKDDKENSGDDKEDSEGDSQGSEGDHVRPAKIVETGPYYMYMDSPCLLGDGEWILFGEWVLNGEPTVYYGGETFFVTEEGMYFFIKDNDWEMFGIDVEAVN